MCKKELLDGVICSETTLVIFRGLGLAEVSLFMQEFQLFVRILKYLSPSTLVKPTCCPGALKKKKQITVCLKECSVTQKPLLEKAS